MKCPSLTVDVRRHCTRGHRRSLRLRRVVRVSAAKKPQWVKDLEEDAAFDEAAARVLEGTDGDPERILEKAELDPTHHTTSNGVLQIRQEQEKKESEIAQARTGVYQPVDVRFREIDHFNLWIWLEFYSAPSVSDLDLLNETLRSWFVVGKLGGYNSANLQISFNAADSLNCFAYDQDRSEEAMDSFLHEMDPLETNGLWGRFRIDMGTADELCLDVLINMIVTFSKEYVGIKSLVIGGENAKWPLPSKKRPGTQVEPEMDAMAKLAQESKRKADSLAKEERERSFVRSAIDREAPSSFDELIGETIDLNDVDAF